MKSNSENANGGGNVRRLFYAVLLIGTVAAAAYFYFFKALVPSEFKTEYVKIPTNSTLEDVVKLLDTEGYISDESNFRQWANWLGFKNPRAGRFRIKSGWSGYDLINHLKTGEQSPVKVVLNNEKTPEQVAAKISKVLEHDSATFAATFNDGVLLDSLGMKKETLMCLFLPNTYEFFWNVEPQKFVERMAKEYKKFWNAERLKLAAAQNLTPEQVVTMASIVEGETNKSDERPKVAAAYLNRLKQNMKLQADPTVQFGLMQIEHTSSFRRLSYADYLTPHPYNTYTHEGLPPGPICMPQSATIDAVLSPEANRYVYFCAKPDNSGYHNFAETYEQHLVNVKIYQTWLAQKK